MSDLVLSRSVYESSLLHPLLKVIESETFRREVEAMGGYDTAHTGNIVSEIT